MKDHYSQKNRLQRSQQGDAKDIIPIVLIAAVVIVIGIFILGALGSSVAGAWGIKLTSAISNTGIGSALLKVSSGITGAAGDVWHGLTVNPWEETKETGEESATETSSSDGMQFLADDFRGPGIMLIPSQPRSGEKLTIRVGVYNPMRDFIADNARLTIENIDEIENKTDIKFAGDLTWKKCASGTGTICDIQAREYAIGEISSTTPAKQIAEENITATAVNIDVALRYRFAGTRKMESGPYSGDNAMPMNEFTFTIRPETSMASEIDKWEQTLIQSKAGGPVEVNLDNRFGLDWDSAMYLDYSIKNTGPTTALKEEIRFTTDFASTASTENKVIIAIPADFGLVDTGKFTWEGSDDDYKYYSAKDRTIFSNELNVNRTIKENGKEGFSLKLKTPVKSADLIGKQYTISIYFLDGAYLFKGVGIKDTAVKP